jgi:tetratricopeptide (TPR) repeat protein
VESRERDDSFPALELALAALVVFLPSVATGFVYDDLVLIRENPHVHGLSELHRAFTTQFWEIGAAQRGSMPYYRPLVTVSYILNWVVAAKPWLFHCFNAVLHAATVFLAACVVRRWTGRTAVAVAVAALFALHPSRTESVEWISGRTDVLMTFFLLASIQASYAAAVSHTRPRRVVALSASIGAFVAALLSKEAAVILPLLLLVDVACAPDRPTRRALATGLGLHSAIALAYLVIRPLFLPFGGPQSHAFTPRYGLLTVFAYAERVLFPWPQTFFYLPLASEGGSFVYPPALVVAGAVVLVSYSALVVYALRKDRVSALLLTVAAAALGPLLNFTHTGVFVTASDHFLYLPLLLLLAGLGRLFRDLLTPRARVRSVRLAFGALLLAYVAVDLVRLLDYRSQETLFRHELAVNPQNPQALKALAEVESGRGNLDAAYDLLRRASLPASTRYSMLSPNFRQYENYLRMLGLMAARTADGNVRDLTLLYRELDALVAGRTNTVNGTVGDLVIGHAVTPALHEYALAYGTRDMLAAEAGLLATRLGDDAHGRELLRSISDRYLEEITNLQNVALAYARLRDFAAADRWLTLCARRFPDRFSTESLTSLRRSFASAEASFRRADTPSPGPHRRPRAEAYLELGAYLRALRVLRPAYDRDPTSAAVGPLYVHLLLGAGLPAEALAAATRALGPEQGAALVASIRAGMSQRLKGLRKPVEPSDWYTAGAAPP